MRQPLPPSVSGSTDPASVSTISRNRIRGISAAAVLLTGSGLLVAEQKPASIRTANPAKPASVAKAALPDDIDVASQVTDVMSFDRAFATARDEVGMGGVFSWHGRWYNTFSKDEWSSLSLPQRKEFVELVMQEELPVKPYHQPVHHAVATLPPLVEKSASAEPTLIEGHLHGQRIIGLDFDHDGMIDTVVMEGLDGHTYRVVDNGGDDSLDTLLRYDALTDQVLTVERLNTPLLLSVDQFSRGLEESMVNDVVDSILQPDLSPSPASTPTDVTHDDEEDLMADDESVDSDDDTDDTYINDGDVHDMDNQTP